MWNQSISQIGNLLILQEVFNNEEDKNPRSYVFVHLKQNTTYTVSVAARNAAEPDKLGPVASVNVTTLPTEKRTVFFHFKLRSKCAIED